MYTAALDGMLCYHLSTLALCVILDHCFLINLDDLAIDVIKGIKSTIILRYYRYLTLCLSMFALYI